MTSIRRAAAILAAGTLAALAWGSTGGSDEPSESSPVERVRVTAERFRFTPPRIKVEPGTRLEIELESRDVEHGFHIIDTEIDARIPPAGGGAVVVVFEAAKSGRHRFQCSKLCGSGHASMSGVIVVRGDER